MKYCVVCAEPRSDEYSFCPQCGNPLQEYHDANETMAAQLSVGNENVIAGDVIGSREEYNIEGNATFVSWHDPSSQVKSCHICGKNLKAAEGYTCPVCGKYTCERDYDVDTRRCAECSRKLDNLGDDTTITPLSFSEEQLLKMEKEKLLSDQITDEDIRRLEHLFSRKRNNPYLKRTFFEVLVDTDPMRLFELPLSVAREDETDLLSLLIEAYTRLRHFNEAEELITTIERNHPGLSDFLNLRRAELYVDLGLAEESVEVLKRAHTLISHVGGDRWKDYHWFVQAYCDWAQEGSHFRELIQQNGTNDLEEMLRISRKRKTLICCSDIDDRLAAGYFYSLQSEDSFPIILSVTIGRGHSFLSSSLADDETVSRSHARVTVDPQLRVYIRDMGSSNGTFLNGQRVNAGREIELEDGATLTIGQQVFRYSRLPEESL